MKGNFIRGKQGGVLGGGGQAYFLAKHKARIVMLI